MNSGSSFQLGIYGFSGGGVVVSAGEVYADNFQLALNTQDSSANVAPPTLTVRTGVGTVTLAWPAGFTGFSLEKTDALTATSWGLVPVTPVQLNGEYVVTTAADRLSGFFRLRHP